MTKDEIVSIVCEVCGVSPSDLVSETRKRNTVAARQLIAYHLCYRTLTMSLKDVAQEVGVGVTALYATATPRAIQAKRRTNLDFWHQYANVQDAIKQATVR